MIRAGQAIACVACGGVGIFQRAVTEEMFPLETACPHCGGVNLFTEGEIYPKVDLAQFDQEPPNWEVPTKEKEFTADKLQGMSFRKQVNLLAETLLAGLNMAGEIQRGIDNLKQCMASDIEEIWVKAHHVIEHWDPKFLDDFIQCPYTTVPICCDDERIEEYTVVLLAPRFYTGLHGFPLGTIGGFRSQIITPYTRFTYELPETLMEAVGLPFPIHLRVVGNKIIGADLKRYLHEIPAITEDIDYTETNPSVRIQKSSVARKWLARHGIPPWESLGDQNPEVLQPLIYDEVAFDTIEAEKPGPITEFLRGTLRVIEQHGRVAMPWRRTELVHSFVRMVARRFRGVPLWVSREHRYRQLETSTLRMRFQSIEEFALSEERIECDLLVFWYEQESDLPAMERLFNYGKRLLLILPDPILDTLEENRVAETAYGLCNTIVPDIDEKWWSETKMFGGIHKLRSRIFLRKMQK